MDPWLTQKLLTTTGGFRAARYRLCTKCSAWTLQGPDDDRAAILATADPTPLTPKQEIECALNDRRTYTIGTTPSGKPQLETRDIYGIGAPIRRTVIPAHKCGHRYPGNTYKNRTPLTDQPPF